MSNNQIRVSLSKGLVEDLKKVLASKLGANVTSKTAVTYALIAAFGTLKTEELTRLIARKEPINKPLYQLLQIDGNSNSNLKSNQKELTALKEGQLKQEILLESLVNSVAWLIFERNGLDTTPLAEDGDDIYAKLRQDSLKHVIDLLIKAGFNEKERQNHLDNL